MGDEDDSVDGSDDSVGASEEEELADVVVHAEIVDVIDDIDDDVDDSDGCRRGLESLSDSEAVCDSASLSMASRGRFPSAGGGADSFPSRDCTRFGPIIG